MEGHSIGSNSNNIVARHDEELFIQQEPGKAYQVQPQ
jgi:hypothetical protein